jgi:hypothetical protein
VLDAKTLKKANQLILEENFEEIPFCIFNSWLFPSHAIMWLWKSTSSSDDAGKFKQDLENYFNLLWYLLKLRKETWRNSFSFLK